MEFKLASCIEPCMCQRGDAKIMCQLHYWSQAEQQFRGSCLTLLKVSLQGSWILSSLQALIYAKISKKKESFLIQALHFNVCITDFRYSAIL